MAKPDAGPVEIELKLRLPPGSHAALEQVPALSAVRAEQRREITRYFDTEDRALFANGFVLRVRSRGNRRIQTLKSAPSDGGVAPARGEWEWPVEREEPDAALLAETPARDIAATLDGRRLEALFVTDIERSTRQLVLDDDTHVEVALDEGTIEAGDAREKVDELELELKSGALGPLYRLAIELHEAVPMWLAPESKSARGYRLRDGTAPRAPHATKLRLDPKVRTNEAFRVIVASGLSQILENIAAAEAAAPEGIHQLRIGLRRVRSALVLFAPLLEPNAAALFERELKRLGQVFGERRDRDVLCLQTLPAVAHDLGASWIDRLRPPAEAYRASANGPVQEALHGAGLTSLALGLAAWCEEGLEHPAHLGHKRLGKRLANVAPDLLDRMARKVARRAKRADTPESLHGLRKSLKKLRYSTEFVAGLYKPKAVKRYRKRCEALQELLGTINDARVTPRLADDMLGVRGTELAPAFAQLAAWSAEQERKALRRLDEALTKFRRTEPFW
ncbi:MAG: CHAD domain-containing protein [Alphaproteobacteria bacterium]|nr:CHAD domain-containing protein [Alphaproteobacteria bacterium]